MFNRDAPGPSFDKETTLKRLKPRTHQLAENSHGKSHKKFNSVFIQFQGNDAERNIGMMEFQENVGINIPSFQLSSIPFFQRSLEKTQALFDYKI